jgi:hypothetical protein
MREPPIVPCLLEFDAQTLRSLVVAGDVEGLIFWLSSFGTDYLLTARDLLGKSDVSGVDSITAIVDPLVPVLLLSRDTALALTSFIYGLSLLSKTFVRHLSDTTFLETWAIPHLASGDDEPDPDQRVRFLQIARQIWSFRREMEKSLYNRAQPLEFLRNLRCVSEAEVPGLIGIWVDIISCEPWDEEVVHTFCNFLCQSLETYPSAETRGTVSKAVRRMLGTEQKSRPLSINICQRIWDHRFFDVVLGIVREMTEDNAEACPHHLLDLILDVVTIMNPVNLPELFDSLTYDPFHCLLTRALEETAESCLRLLHYFCLRAQAIAEVCADVPGFMAKKWNVDHSSCPLESRICWIRFAHAMMFHLKLGLVKSLLDEGLIAVVTGFIPDPEFEFMDATIQLLLGVHTISMMLEACTTLASDGELLCQVVSALLIANDLLECIAAMPDVDDRPDITWTVWVPDKLIDVRTRAGIILTIVSEASEAVGSARTW